MKEICFALTLWIGVIGCGNSQTKDSSSSGTQELERKDSLYLVVKEESVVIFRPNSAEVDSLKEIQGEDFYIVADDANFYASQAYQLLERRNIKEVTTKKRFIQFVKANGQMILLDKRELQNLWGAILFHPDNDPKEVPLVDLEFEMDSYFSGEQ